MNRAGLKLRVSVVGTPGLGPGGRVGTDRVCEGVDRGWSLTILDRSVSVSVSGMEWNCNAYV